MPSTQRKYADQHASSRRVRALARARGQQALTMIEVLVATMILSIGTVGLLTAFDGGRRATTYAELHSIATEAAERELQRVGSLEWSKIALNGTSSTYTANSASPTDPTSYLKAEECDKTSKLPSHGAPCYEYAWGVPADVEPLVLKEEKAGKKEADETVDPLTFTTLAPGGSTRLTVTVYRYITWAVDSECKTTICSSETNEKLDPKRVTVAVEVTGLRTPVVMSTLATDTDAGETHPLDEAKCEETKEGKEEKVACQ